MLQVTKDIEVRPAVEKETARDIQIERVEINRRSGKIELLLSMGTSTVEGFVTKAQKRVSLEVTDSLMENLLTAIEKATKGKIAESFGLAASAISVV